MGFSARLCIAATPAKLAKDSGRPGREFRPPPNAIRHYFEQEERLAALKDAIKRTLSADHIVTERVAVDQNGRFAKSYLEGFAARIQAKLKSAIDRHIALVEATERAPDYALQSERDAHRAFGERKLEIFVGREPDCGGDQVLIMAGAGLGAAFAAPNSNSQPQRKPRRVGNERVRDCCRTTPVVHSDRSVRRVRARNRP